MLDQSGIDAKDQSRAHCKVRAVRAGVVHVSEITVPLGGFGRDKSLHALEKYTDLKTAWIQL